MQYSVDTIILFFFISSLYVNILFFENIYNILRKSRKYSSYKGQVGKISDNKIKRNFKVKKPYTKITTDTTEFKYFEKDKSGTYQIKKLYLNPYLDMYNSEILSYEISKHPTIELILKALDKAIKITNKSKEKRIFHSDQSWAYQKINIHQGGCFGD